MGPFQPSPAEEVILMLTVTQEVSSRGGTFYTAGLVYRQLLVQLGYLPDREYQTPDARIIAVWMALDQSCTMNGLPQRLL